MNSEEQVSLRMLSQPLSAISELCILRSHVDLTTATSKAEEKHTSKAHGQCTVQSR